MKFNSNQRYTRWSIRRLSVGVASVVVASGFFVLVGQPSSAHADVVKPTPAQVVPDAASVSEKSDLPADVLKKAVDVALPSEQSIPTPKASLDTTSSSEKADATAKDPVVASKEEKPESKKQTEVAVKPATNPAPAVSGQDREASEAQPATTPTEVQKGVADNTKDTVDVPATYLDKANFPGPFTAGVNQVIPYEFFAGDGMLTRLILKASDKAPWSDNGSAKNPALPPVENLGKGLYFYEVDLAGTQGKSDKELLDLLKQNGTQSYKATIKVYGAKDGKADLNNLVATKGLDVNLNGLTTPAEVQKGVADNTKDTVDVPATYLDKANFPGPFTAGVNQVIPYEFFAGDGMLTRLILKASDKAPWSDNGSAKNPALPPVEKLSKGLYFYEVDLAGTQGKSDKELLDLLKQNGTQSYKATIKVYGAKDGKADLTNLVATKGLDVNLNGLTTLAEVQKGVADNTKDTVDVPATYLDKANFPGSFTAGVNQVIPYEFFAGDGMLTRLILKASDKAPWSDNGSAKNPALPPVEKLGKGLYFYEVDLAGTQGKSDKDLLDLLKQNGTQSYKATIKVYGAKDGKADLSNLVATKDLTVNLNGHQSLTPMQSGFVPSSNGSAMPAPMMNSHQDASKMNAQMPATSQDKMMSSKEQDKTMNASQPMATPSMKQDQASAASSKMSDEGKMSSNNKESNLMMADKMKDQKDMLPYTGEAQTSMATLGFFGLALAGLLGGLGLKAKKEEND